MLELRNISKSYGRFQALKSVNLTISPGEIHGLVGVNGSGKSTLLNILSGQRVIRDTGGFKGELLFENADRKFADPGQALGAGIGMVHQEFALIPGLSVADNICLSNEKTFSWSQKLFGDDLACINHQANRNTASAILGHMGIDLSPDLMAGDLSVAMKQFVELAREFNRDHLKLLLLDEPTAVLGNRDARCLMTAVKEIAAKGVAVLYVSHRLEEVVSCCDSMTVLRNGAVVDCIRPKQPGQNQDSQNQIKTLSNLMVGKKVKKTRRSQVNQVNQVNRVNKIKMIRFSSFSVEKPGDRLDSLDLDIFQGEILGVTSLSGHGRTALGAGIMGLYPAKGAVRLKGQPIRSFDPLQMIKKNIWMLPEDRRSEGLLLGHSIMENMTFAAIQTRKKFVRKSVIPFVRFPDQKKCRAYADAAREALDIDCRSIYQNVGELSGGNQQKVCIANALAMAPELLFVNDPTRGIDIAAREFILSQLLKAQSHHGMTLVISSGELDELKRICDRIAVLYQGRLFDVLTPDQSEKEYLLACSGIRPEEAV
ncbi:MAG: sugar ABC transporter ATP-binding protein [Desulfobacterium sp.]|nr:sugar ABC transporter ATP-binding protein [Desulfobacterium sp.]